ncbi:hypothetical protein BaRGS_00016716 [Batillaria attramentaria]|uniref:Uncharacterized protein n=1 Tax=Batillaria attramentaria TaxID=370345 RepID=A0ABD0KY36_9CAEN
MQIVLAKPTRRSRQPTSVPCAHAPSKQPAGLIESLTQALVTGSVAVAGQREKVVPCESSCLPVFQSTSGLGTLSTGQSVTTVSRHVSSV